MKLLFASVLLVASISTAHAQLIEKDQVQHFMVSAAAGAIVVNARPDWPSGQQFLVAMVPGLAKELVDSRKGGSGFSTRDLLADAAGAYAGVQGWRWFIAPKEGGGAEVQWNLKF